MAYAHKVDANQREIVDALRAVGADVRVMSMVGGGFPDLLVGWRGRLHLLEVKMPGARLTAPERNFLEAWRDYDVHITRSASTALRVIGAVDGNNGD